MRKSTVNTFSEGMIKDLNPLNTPNNVLTDALNATFITYNGDEFVLQNDMGNCKVERAKLSVGFIPVGMKEYGGIIYVASYNPETGESEIGSFPSPERDFSTIDFANLSPAKFKTSDYVVNTGQSSTEERTSVLKKLVEPELMELSPGDMFLVTYDIHEPTPVSGADIIDDKDKMDEYITSDISDRKLFRLRFYKVTDDNNLSEIDPEDMKLVDASDDLEGQYVYFKEKNKGTIAVGLELETLDTFDINVIDTSKRTDVTKSATIEAIGFSDSLADFEGVKVDITDPSEETFYIQKTANVKKVSAKVTELEANTKLIGSITPYSKYALYPRLKKDFNLELGRYASPGTGINDIFKYLVGPNTVTVDFDFKFEGNNDNGLVLYVEFYDPWSDYSIIKVVDNPTYYGINTIQLELVTEPRIDQFDSVTTGGTPTNLLITNPDTTFQKTLLNTSGLIRNTATLRRNHFYIVRISGIDIDNSGPTSEYIHYDLYKGLFTNDLLNQTYINQNSIPSTDPNYISDFNTIDFKLEDMVKYSNTVTNADPLTIKSALINTENGQPKTDNKYYTISTVDTPGGNYKSGYTYSKSESTDVDLTLSGLQYIFGTLKDDLISIEFPNIDPSEGPVDPSLVPTIEDVGYINDEPNINPNSTVQWNLQEVNPLKYKINKSMSTSRWVYANKIKHNSGSENITETITDEIPVEDRFAYVVGQGYSASAIQFDATGAFSNANNGNGRWTGTKVYNSCLANKINHTTMSAAFANAYGNTKQTAFFVAGRISAGSEVPASCTTLPSGYAKGSYVGLRYDDGYIYDGGATLLWVRRPDGYFATLTGPGNNNPSKIKEMSKYLRVHSSIDSIVYVYYADPNNVKYNDPLTTLATFNNLYYTLTYDDIADTKTYLSTFKFKALNTVTDFSAQVINDYIESRKSDSQIVDDKLEINDGFIPYIDYEIDTVVPIPLNQLSISESAPSNMITLYRDAHNVWRNDPRLTNTSTLNHGQVYSTLPKYEEAAKMFETEGVIAGVALNPNNFQLNGVAPSVTGGGWKGLKNGSVIRDEFNYTARINTQLNLP